MAWMQFKPTPDFQVFPATVTWEQVNYPHPIWTKLQLSIVVYLYEQKKFDSGLLFFSLLLSIVWSDLLSCFLMESLLEVPL